MLKVLLLSGALALTAATAQATTVFTDNFNTDAYGLNSPGDDYFTSTSPPLNGPKGSTINAPGLASVDIIGKSENGTSFYDLITGNGLYVDLDGSSGYGNAPVAGQLTYKGTFLPGTYLLTFDLAGNQRGAPPQNLTVVAGDMSETFSAYPGFGVKTLPSSNEFTEETFKFTATSTENGLQFTEAGPSDQQGNLLDNVSVSAVPEPATWAMMLLGFFGMAFAIRSNRRSSLRLA